MVKLVKNDYEAALVLCWLKYVPVTEQDVEMMDKTPEIVKNSKRKLLTINDNENPEIQNSKSVKNSSSGLMKLTEISCGSISFGKNPKNHEASSYRDFTSVSNRVKDSSSGLMNLTKNSSGSSRFSKNPETPEVQISKRVKDSSSGLMNLTKKSSGSSRFSKNPETPEVQISKRVKNSSSGLMNLTKNSSGSSRFNKNPVTHEASSCRNFNPVPKKRDRVLPAGLMNLPKLPPIENLTTLIGECSNPFVKQLTNSDVADHQGRLLMNNEDVRKQLLPLLLNEEYEELVINGIKLEAFDSMGNSYEMTFRAWGNYKTYVLIGNWIQFIKDHELKMNDYVIVRMFRHYQTGKLCFALTWKRKDEEEEEG